MDGTLTEHSRSYSDFSSILDYSSYDPLPDDWLIGAGLPNVVDSGSAIRRGASRMSTLPAYRSLPPSVTRGALTTSPLPLAAMGQPLRCQQTAWIADCSVGASSGFGKNGPRFDAPRGAAPGERNSVPMATMCELQDTRASRHTSFSMFAGGGLKWAERELREGPILGRAGQGTLGARP